jgi:hypothetical protein
MKSHMRYTLFFESAAAGLVGTFSIHFSVYIRGWGHTRRKRLQQIGLHSRMLDQELGHLLVRDEEVFICWMRIFGVAEAEEEVCEVDACGGLSVGREILARCFGDGYFGGPFGFAWHLDGVL